MRRRSNMLRVIYRNCPACKTLIKIVAGLLRRDSPYCEH